MKIFATLLTLLSILFSSASWAEVSEVTIIIKDHLFTPNVVNIAAGEKVKLIIDNQDSTPEEFESHSMNREKVISGNSKGIVYIGPLEPGEYKFFGEFNEDSAQGKVVVK